MYGSLAVDLDGYSAFYKPNILLDPESSETTIDEEASDSFEETDDDRDLSEESSSLDGSSGEDNEYVPQSSGEYVSPDNHSDDGSDNEDIQYAAETETGSDAGSDYDTGTASGDPEDGSGEGINDDNNDDEYVEYDDTQYDSESRDPESGTESGTSVREDSSTTIDYYNQSIELLGIIAGLLFFIVFTIIMKYIYKFFRLFI